jgi:hypothetical protein
MNRKTIFGSGCFAHACLTLLLLGAGCTSRVDLAQERASSTAADGAPAEPVDGTAGVGGGASSGGSGNVGSGATGGSGVSTGFECPGSCTSLPIRVRTDLAGTPFQLEPGEEAYVCVGYEVTWPLDRPAQIVAFSPVIDNEHILHGFELFAASTPQVNGSFAFCSDAPPQGVRVYHWAPGTGPLVLPAGSEIPLGAWDAVLAVHYINVGASTEFDTSGVSACVCPI